MLRSKKFTAILLTFVLLASSAFAGNAYTAKAATKSDSGIAFNNPGGIYTGFKLVFEDNFDGNSLDSRYWNYEEHERGWVNNEQQRYANKAECEAKGIVYVKDGNLVINPQNYNGDIVSGRINTKYKADYTYGIFECRAKVPSGNGYLPAFWMMPTNEATYGDWPRCGEIDIMEVLGRETNCSLSTLHFGNDTGSGHIQKQGKYWINGSFASDYHTYTCKWDPDEITFYVDGRQTYKVTSDQWWTGGSGKARAPYDQNFYMILNVAIGGEWPGYVNPYQALPGNPQMKVDYVRAYQWAGNTGSNTVNTSTGSTWGQELIKNGNFSNGTYNWETYAMKGTSGPVADFGVEYGRLKSNVYWTGDNDWDIQISQKNVPLTKNQKYVLSLDIDSSVKRTVRVGFTSGANYTWGGGSDIVVYPGVTHYEVPITAQVSDSSAKFFISLGKVNNTDSRTAQIFLDNISLKAN